MGAWIVFCTVIKAISYLEKLKIHKGEELGK
jgi:hypothetical protein